ncbi:hypothetical protein AVEN_52050-1 [Araneus ventricosus]|uniref:Uncharacterized protein n=1 Tax=Araneus ventricosus TaxID=182803 RepID=A0A4Y2CGE2_ARAVE|nr:hypothetical protein AVEN_52050-1 [Araneus ventricosus]
MIRVEVFHCSAHSIRTPSSSSSSSSSWRGRRVRPGHRFRTPEWDISPAAHPGRANDFSSIPEPVLHRLTSLLRWPLTSLLLEVPNDSGSGWFPDRTGRCTRAERDRRKSNQVRFRFWRQQC